jgi:predicted DNA-binding transcriptional regulator AlpA
MLSIVRAWIPMADGEDLLPRVDVYRLSDGIRRELARLMGDAVRDALDKCGRLPHPTGALKATQAAAYIGLSRSKFYEVLKKDPGLMQQSFTVGKCRLWPISTLDSWIHAPKENRGPP